jgi:hypothetical protein
MEYRNNGALRILQALSNAERRLPKSRFAGTTREHAFLQRIKAMFPLVEPSGRAI